MKLIGIMAKFEQLIHELTVEEFNDLVIEILKERYHYSSAINVDGPNDGGCDIKLYKGATLQRRCVQCTIRKDIEIKFYSDEPKIKSCVIDYGYDDDSLFFTSSSISGKKINELRNHAFDNYGINVEIIDAQVIDGWYLDCVRRCFEKKYGRIDSKLTDKLNPSTKMLFDILSMGENTSDVKNNLIDSLVILALYKSGQMTKKQLQNNVGSYSQNRVLSIDASLHRLMQADRVEKIVGALDTYTLTAEEKTSVEDISETSELQRKALKEGISTTALKYGISDLEEKLVDLIVDTYKESYQHNLEEDQSGDDAFKFITKLQKILRKRLSEQDTNVFLEEVFALCSRNQYIMQSVSGETFLQLYNSDKLDSYLQKQERVIYLDTRVILYMVCHAISTMDKIDLCEEDDWQDMLYRSVKCLEDVVEHDPHIRFAVLENYLFEAAGEIHKAIKLGWLETASIAELGSTSNVFYNYFLHLNQLDNIDDLPCETFFKYTSFLFDVDESNADAPIAISLIKQFIVDVLEFNRVEIVRLPFVEDYSSYRDLYEKVLANADKEKSPEALSNDLKQVLYLGEKENVDRLNDSNGYCSRYLSTWDTTIRPFSKKLRTEYPTRFSHFYIFSPIKLINKLTFADFKLSGNIPSDLFIYADYKYDLSKKVNNLVDALLPLCGNNNVFRKTSELKKMYEDATTDDMQNNKQLFIASTIEEFFVKVVRDLPTKVELTEFPNISGAISKETLQQYLLQSENVDFMMNQLKEVLNGTKVDYVYNIRLDIIRKMSRKPE